MAGSDPFSPEFAGRAMSPALSDTSELTVLSRSSSPVPDYQEASRRIEAALPLAPPGTLKRSRAANGRFTSRHGKRARSPGTSS